MHVKLVAMTRELIPAPEQTLVISGNPAQTDYVIRLTASWLRTKADTTQVAYRKDLAYWIAWCNSIGVPPLAARMHHMDDWIAAQRERGASGRPSAEASIARRVATVSSWYKYLIRNTKEDPVPLVTTNPADTDARPDIDPDDSPTTGLSAQEADALIAAADRDGLRSSALIRLLLWTGARCGSAIAADVEHLGWYKGYRVLTIHMKGRKKRRAPFPVPLEQAVGAMLADRGNPATGPLFVTRHGNRLTEPYIFVLVQRLAQAAGIPSAGTISPHSLRHTFATEYLNAKGNLRDLQDAMGHADPRTTRRYDRARDQVDRHPAHILSTVYGVRRDG